MVNEKELREKIKKEIKTEYRIIYNGKIYKLEWNYGTPSSPDWKDSNSGIRESSKKLDLIKELKNKIEIRVRNAISISGPWKEVDFNL